MVLDQLKDLELYTPDDPQTNFVRQFTSEEFSFDLYQFLTCAGSKKFLRKKKWCAIAIKVPCQRLDAIAHEIKIETPLTQAQCTYFVKAPFDRNKADNFNSFSATEHQKLMVDGFLSKELDFEEMMESGVIVDHFPLHKRKFIAKMQEQFEHSYYNLKRGFLVGTFRKYMMPLNMIKNYYGENYAFEYAFLIHYQAWLQIPTYTGIMLTIYQAYRWFETGSLMFTLDTPLNAIFGLAVNLWATCFVESWKRKQRML